MAELLEGEVIARREADGRVVIDQAPPIARMSLELLAQYADRVIVEVRGDRISLAGQVSYRVAGWDAHSHALLLEREGPSPAEARAAMRMVDVFPPGAGTKGA